MTRVGNSSSPSSALPWKARDRFSTCWIGGRLLPLAHVCINSFVAHAFDVDLYTYGPVHDAPEGIALRDAESILPRRELFIAHGGVETSTEFFAYRLLHDVGGWVFDNDVLCNSFDVPDAEVVFAEEIAGKINNAVLRFPKGHAAIRDLLAYVATVDPATAPWGTTGPLALTKIFGGHPALHGRKLPMETIYPLHWKDAPKVLFPEFTDEVLERTARSPFIHLWGSALREIAFDFTRSRPLPGSYLDLQVLAVSRSAGSDGASVPRRIRVQNIGRGIRPEDLGREVALDVEARSARQSIQDQPKVFAINLTITTENVR